MQAYRADLHVHTVLSPCAAVEMIPPLIVQTALEKDIRLIAITDHNSSANVSSVQEAAQGTELFVLPGMEVQTQEEVHLLCIFDQIEQLIAWQKIVDQKLPALENNPEYFGEQYIVDMDGNYLDSETRLLISSVQLSIEQCTSQVHSLGGLAIPAHVNRKAFGLFENLGFLPAEAAFDALEISRHTTPDKARQDFPQIGSYPLIQNGDVHQLDSFLGRSIYWMDTPSVEELHLAIHNKNDRWHRILQDSEIDKYPEIL